MVLLATRSLHVAEVHDDALISTIPRDAAHSPDAVATTSKEHAAA
jgi:hypothetical protein